jgi:heme/copper-type cytochrome/quinol oxidase subunit 3
MSAPTAAHPSVARASRLVPARFGVWLFLVSEAMFFAALISAYLVLRAGSPNFGGPGAALGLVQGGCATLALVTSSACAWRALVLARDGAGQGRVSTWILGTLAFGAAFLMIQGLEYRALFARGLSPRSSLYWSCFFVLTALHALHVLGGLAWLAGARRGIDGGTRALRIELAVLYWQLVDVVWLALFALLYL